MISLPRNTGIILQVGKRFSYAYKDIVDSEPMFAQEIYKLADNLYSGMVGPWICYPFFRPFFLGQTNLFHNIQFHVVTFTLILILQGWIISWCKTNNMATSFYSPYFLTQSINPFITAHFGVFQFGPIWCGWGFNINESCEVNFRDNITLFFATHTCIVGHNVQGSYNFLF